jgi:hypothetical protein
MVILTEKEYARLVLSSSRLLSVENLIDMLDEQNLKENQTTIRPGKNCINYDSRDLIVKIKEITRHPVCKYAVWLAAGTVKEPCRIPTFLKSFMARNISSK